MKYKLLFAFTALLVSVIGAPKLSASQCTGDANNCTPVQLCDGATEKANGKVRWTTAPSLKRYVESAKELSMDCGVIEPIITCKSNPEICTISQLCKEATYQTEGRTVWKRGAVYRKHVQLAESFGLQCDIKETNIFVVTTDTVWLRIEDKNNKTIFEKTTKKREEIFLPQDSSPYRMRGGMAGSVYLKIDNQIYGPVGKGTNSFNNFLISASFIQRNLEKTTFETVGVQPAESKPAQTRIIKKDCLKNPTSCSDDSLCHLATYSDGQVKERKWGKGHKTKFVAVAKARGLSCNTNTNIFELTSEAVKSKSKIRILKEEAKRPQHKPEVTKKCEIDKLSNCSDSELCLKWHLRQWNVKEAVFSRGFYCENGKKAALPLDDATFCKKFTSRGSMSGSDLYWSPKEAKIEGKRRGLICDVAKSKDFLRAQKVLSTITLIQKELNRIGCNIGEADGVIGPNTRKGLFAFTTRTEFLYNPKLLQDVRFLEAVKRFPQNTCPKIPQTRTTKKIKPEIEVLSGSGQDGSSANNNAELQRLIRERELLQDNLRTTQQLMEQQQRAANRPYKACLGNCLMNNKAGKGFAAAFSGMAQCNSSCAPLKWGGAVVPPTWERDVKQLKRYDCMITKLNKNQASLNCNQF